MKPDPFAALAARAQARETRAAELAAALASEREPYGPIPEDPAVALAEHATRALDALLLIARNRPLPYWLVRRLETETE